jgi:hypothetical protein
MTPPHGPTLTIPVVSDLAWEVPVSAVELIPLAAARASDGDEEPEGEAIVRVLAATTSTPRAVIERIVAEELGRFRGARIRTYVPILVEAAAARRLRGASSEV